MISNDLKMMVNQSSGLFMGNLICTTEKAANIALEELKRIKLKIGFLEGKVKVGLDTTKISYGLCNPSLLGIKYEDHKSEFLYFFGYNLIGSNSFYRSLIKMGKKL